MKTNPVLPLVLSLLLWASTSYAQEDTVRVSYSEEPATTSNFSLKEKYRYFTRATLEEKSMFKVGISRLNIGWAGNFGFILGLEHIIAFERKIGVPFSVMGQYRNLNGFNYNSPKEMGIDVGVRYYYALPARIKKGKSANNFSANYFSLQSDNTLSWGERVTNLNPIQFEYGNTSVYSLSLLYGLQRRLGKYGYVDVNVGYQRRLDNMSQYVRPINRGGLDANFSIGVAF